MVHGLCAVPVLCSRWDRLSPQNSTVPSTSFCFPSLLLPEAASSTLFLFAPTPNVPPHGTCASLYACAPSYTPQAIVRARARKVVVDARGTGEAAVASLPVLPPSGGGGAHAAAPGGGEGGAKTAAAAGQAEADPSAGGFSLFRCAGVLMLVTFFFCFFFLVAPATSDRKKHSFCTISTALSGKCEERVGIQIYDRTFRAFLV